MRAVSRVAPVVAAVCLALTSLVAPVAPVARADTGDVAYDAGLQWGLERIGVADAWSVSQGAGVTIAVIDSGVALEHEDLADHLVNGVACRNTGGDPAACTGSPADDDGHGTHVAGIAAAVTGNGVGIAGVAPEARIMPIKVLFSDCSGCTSAGNADDVTAAVRWAVERGADVVNLSLGSTSSSVFGPGFADAVDFAWSQGAIPVVAAGNDAVLAADLGDAPAVVVSATNRDDAAPPYSAGVGSARWAIAAPGGDGDDTADTCAQDGAPRGILSTYWAPDDPRSAYACLSGTSMAAAHVSGALALLLATGLEPDDAVTRMLATAVDIGEPGPDPVFGAGRLDVGAAIAAQPAAPPESPAPTTPGTGVSPATTPPAGGTPGSDDGETGAPAPQRFVHDSGDDVPVLPVAVAVLAIVAVAAADVWLLRRGRR